MQCELKQHVEARPFCIPLLIDCQKDIHQCTGKWRHTQINIPHSSCASPPLVSPCDWLGWQCLRPFPPVQQSRIALLLALCNCCRGRAKTHTHTHILHLLTHIFSTHHRHDTTTMSTIIQAASPSLPLPSKRSFIVLHLHRLRSLGE